MILSTDKFFRVFRSLLPSPFTIAVILTLVTFACAFLFTGAGKGPGYIAELGRFWYDGLWKEGLIVFAFQMMLMLVLGHSLALSAPVSRFIGNITKHCTTTPRAAFIVTLATLLVSFLNWGLGLVFGAILARKTGEASLAAGRELNYPLIGAAGYSGLMVWHGGLSGSAPLKVAQEGHFLENVTGVIPVSETLFSGMNLFTALALLVTLPVLMYLTGRSQRNAPVNALLSSGKTEGTPAGDEKGLERLDRSGIFSRLAGFAVALAVIYLVGRPGEGLLTRINPDMINLALLALCLLLHRNLKDFLGAVDNGMPGASGILIQFPLYFGIMGIMSGTGMIGMLSDWFVSVSGPVTFPLYTLFSAGIVNIFVPSGGGQWAVQGPVIAEAAREIGVPLWKAVMAMAYGDQLTNMLQPFWALPLLGITGLKAKEILPYSMLLLLAGLVIFSVVLLIF